MTTTAAEPLQGLRRHKLITAEIAKALPPIRSTDGQGDQAIAHAKLFCPWSTWTLYVTEYDPAERLLYGWGGSPDPEWGYSSLDEIALVTVAGGTPAIERDCHWTPRTIAECKADRP